MRDVKKINRLLIVTVILNYRYKLNIIVFWVSDLFANELVERFITSLKLDIENLYNHYNSGQGMIASSSSQPTTSSSSLSPSISNMWMILYHENKASRNIFQCKSKVDRYFMENVETPSNISHILTW